MKPDFTLFFKGTPATTLKIQSFKSITVKKSEFTGNPRQTFNNTFLKAIDIRIAIGYPI